MFAIFELSSIIELGFYKQGKDEANRVCLLSLQGLVKYTRKSYLDPIV